MEAKKKDNLVSLVSGLLERKKKYFENPEYIKVIKEEFIKLFGGGTRVIVFGSFAKGEQTPQSDIDILVISENIPKDPEEESRIRAEIKKKVGGITAPFQIHFSTPSQYENWWRKFIKDEFFEV